MNIILHNATRVGRNPMLRVNSLHAYVLTCALACKLTRLHAYTLPVVPWRSPAFPGAPWRILALLGVPRSLLLLLYYYLPLRKQLSESFINQTESYPRARTLSTHLITYAYGRFDA